MKLLFICNLGMQRSPTAAKIFENKHETQFAGIYRTDTKEFEKLLEWADIAYVM